LLKRRQHQRLERDIIQKNERKHLDQRRYDVDRDATEKKCREPAHNDGIRQSADDQAQNSEQNCKYSDWLIERNIAKNPGKETHDAACVAALIYGDAGAHNRQEQRGKPCQSQIRENHTLKNIDNDQQQSMENY